ncbi:8236_t:CDS:2 [Paraglomus occultum]|uniref:8236_t:CDS:1 n=1 Tax=Paraglomus occultum TaxID=144539 RepID=A0A9N9AAU0_9GLOM|nr:8236_t:CDS:2 [Paraglomus occultum]
MKLFIFSLITLLACFTPVTYSWGAAGHRTVGRIAQNFLTDDVSNQVNALLGESLEAVSTWADEIKRKDPSFNWAKPLHFIDTHDNPPKTCTVSMVRTVRQSVIANREGALLQATITNYTYQLDSSNGFKFGERNIALKFLTHFLGDITQRLYLIPALHACGKETGGLNVNVTFNQESDKLHFIWDDNMIEKRLQDFSSSSEETMPGESKFTDADIEAYATTLTLAITSGSYKDIKSDWTSCIGEANAVTQCPLQWASDTNALNCNNVVWKYVLDNPNEDLAGDYYNAVVPYIDMQLAKGGYRLGMLLNHVLGRTESIVLQDYNDSI